MYTATGLMDSMTDCDEGSLSVVAIQPAPGSLSFSNRGLLSRMLFLAEHKGDI